MGAFFLGLTGGFFAWIATTLLGQPLYAFFGLRNEAARLLALYETDGMIDLERQESGVMGPKDRSGDRLREYRDCGARLLAFAMSQTLVVKGLQRFRLFPRAAADHLKVLGSLGQHTETHDAAVKALLSALRLERY